MCYKNAPNLYEHLVLVNQLPEIDNLSFFVLPEVLFTETKMPFECSWHLDYLICLGNEVIELLHLEARSVEVGLGKAVKLIV